MKATKWIKQNQQIKKDIAEFGFAKTEINKDYPSLF